MAGQPYALVALLIAMLASAARGQSTIAPQAGILVLRNGGILEGEVTQAGDYYVVTQGVDVEFRMPKSQVEAFCGSLDEAYEFKSRHLAGSGARPHLDLAEWCLRHGLHARCAQELVAAMRLEPEHPRLKQLEKRLELAVREPLASPPSSPPAAAVSLEQIEKTVAALPKGSVEKFSATIQPILLNRCGANQCHGPNAQNEFRLLRPPSGHAASRRFTQRNLYSALRYLDQSNPEESPLVTLPQNRHGSAPAAIFDKHTQSQLAELLSWVRLATGASAPANGAPPPATIMPAAATLSQPLVSGPSQPTGTAHHDAGSAPENTPEAGSSRTTRPTPGPAAPPAATDRFVPKDAYDPELFNRRFHGPKP